MTVVTGVVDAASFLRLGHVFVANMTGNIIFPGSPWPAHRDSRGPPLWRRSGHVDVVADEIVGHRVDLWWYPPLASVQATRVTTIRSSAQTFVSNVVPTVGGTDLRICGICGKVVWS